MTTLSSHFTWSWVDIYFTCAVQRAFHVLAHFVENANDVDTTMNWLNRLCSWSNINVHIKFYGLSKREWAKTIEMTRKVNSTSSSEWQTYERPKIGKQIRNQKYISKSVWVVFMWRIRAAFGQQRYALFKHQSFRVHLMVPSHCSQSPFSTSVCMWEEIDDRECANNMKTIINRGCLPFIIVPHWTSWLCERKQIWRKVFQLIVCVQHFDEKFMATSNLSLLSSILPLLVRGMLWFYVLSSIRSISIAMNAPYDVQTYTPFEISCSHRRIHDCE